MIYGEDEINMRAATRATLDIDPLLLDEQGRFLGRVADISLKGILLHGKGAVPDAGAVMVGKLEAPSLEGVDESKQAVRVSVAWAHREEGSSWFVAGCAFEMPDGVQKENISEILRALNKKE